MSPIKSISHENRAHPIATLSLHSHQCAWRFALPPPLSGMALDRGARAYFTQDQLDIRQRPTGPASRDVGRGFKCEVKQPGKRAHPRRTVMIATFRSLAACGAVLSTVAAADAQSIDWAKVDGIFGRTGTVGGAVHRYGFPRTDLTVTLDGVTIRPTLALGGWIALQPMGNMAVVMGDLVVLQSEVNPVMAKLLEGGLEGTAGNNQLAT